MLLWGRANSGLWCDVWWRRLYCTHVSFSGMIQTFLLFICSALSFIFCKRDDGGMMSSVYHSGHVTSLRLSRDIFSANLRKLDPPLPNNGHFSLGPVQKYVDIWTQSITWLRSWLDSRAHWGWCSGLHKSEGHDIYCWRNKSVFSVMCFNLGFKFIVLSCWRQWRKTHTDSRSVCVFKNITCSDQSLADLNRKQQLWFPQEWLQRCSKHHVSCFNTGPD